MADSEALYTNFTGLTGTVMSPETADELFAKGRQEGSLRTK